MKVFVCGAAGWTGRAVLSGLTSRHEVCAFDHDATAWEQWTDIDGPPPSQVKIVHGDIADFDTVDRCVSRADAVIHLAVCFPSHDANASARDDLPFLVNLKGLWNTLESSRRHGVCRVVHVGSCQTVHPRGVFFDSEVRRTDGHLYAVCKRLQEEMCRQYYEAHRLSIVVLRPDYVVDSRLGIGRFREPLGPECRQPNAGWVCRHDLAKACRLAIENTTIDFEVLHVVSTAGADRTCNVARTREVLGLEFCGRLDRFR